MKLGDMTFKQIAKLCNKYDYCLDCPLFNDSPNGITLCKLQDDPPCSQQLDLEVNSNDQS